MNTLLVWIIIVSGAGPQYQPTSFPHQFFDKESCLSVANIAQNQYAKTTCVQVRLVK